MFVAKCYTVREVSEILGLAQDATLALIARGDLPASNLNTREGAVRPRWRITDADLGRFLLETRHQVNRKPSMPARRKSRPKPVDHFA